MRTVGEQIFIDLVKEQCCNRSAVTRKDHEWAASIAKEAAEVWVYANPIGKKKAGA